MSTTNPAKKPKLLDFDDDIVKLKIGVEGGLLLVHRSHLQRTSAFFQAALKEVWKEGQDREVTLPEDEKELINLYLNYVYTGVIPFEVIDPETSSISENIGDEFINLAKLFVLGEKYHDITLKNRIIDAIIWIGRTVNCYPSHEAASIIYKGTVAGSSARQLMVDLYVTRGYSYFLDGAEGSINEDFLLDLARQLMQRDDDSELNVTLVPLEESTYHESEEDRTKD